MKEAYVQQWRSYDNDRSISNTDPFAFVYKVDTITSYTLEKLVIPH